MQGRCSKESAHGIQIEASARQPSHNPSPYVPLIRPVHARITARALAGARDNQGRSLPPRDDRVGISFVLDFGKVASGARLKRHTLKLSMVTAELLT